MDLRDLGMTGENGFWERVRESYPGSERRQHLAVVLSNDMVDIVTRLSKEVVDICQTFLIYEKQKQCLKK